MIQALVAGGAYRNRRDELGLTLFYVAATGNHEGPMRFLLAHGADPDIPLDKRISPVHVMAARGNVTIAGMLLESGADRDALGPDGATPLDVDIRSGEDDVASLLEEDTVSDQGTRRADTVPSLSRLNEVLLEAALHGSIERVKQLLDLGADVNARTWEGWSVLPAAVEYDLEVV